MRLFSHNPVGSERAEGWTGDPSRVLIDGSGGVTLRCNTQGTDGRDLICLHSVNQVDTQIIS